jgi:hypothetical protein
MRKKKRLNIFTMGAGGSMSDHIDGFREKEREAHAREVSRLLSNLMLRFEARVHLGGSWGVREKTIYGYGWVRPEKRCRIHRLGIAPYGNALDKLTQQEEERQTLLVLLMVLTDALKRLGREDECKRAYQKMRELGTLPKDTPFRCLTRGAFPCVDDATDVESEQDDAELTLVMRTLGKWPTDQERAVFKDVASKITKELARKKIGEIDDENWGGGTMELTAIGLTRGKLRACVNTVLKGVTSVHGRDVRQRFAIE